MSPLEEEAIQNLIAQSTRLREASESQTRVLTRVLERHDEMLKLLYELRPVIDGTTFTVESDAWRSRIDAAIAKATTPR